MAVMHALYEEKKDFYNWQVENGSGYLVSVSEKEWENGIEPLNIWMRYEIGRVLKLDEIDKTADTVAKMLAASDTYKDSIDQFVKEYVYNLGSSASVGAKYIIQEIQKAIKRHKEQE